jgi:hypothetical protein
MSSRVRTWQSDLRARQIPRRTALLSGAALPLGLMIGKAAPATARKSAPSPRLTLPGPTGRHRLGTTSLYLIDPSRPDAWVPTQRAQVMIQLWYPADVVDRYPRAPWMPPTTRTPQARPGQARQPRTKPAGGSLEAVDENPSATATEPASSQGL